MTTNMIWQFLASLLGVIAAYTVVKTNGSLNWGIKFTLGILVAAVTGVLVAITQSLLQHLGICI